VLTLVLSFNICDYLVDNKKDNTKYEIIPTVLMCVTTQDRH